MKTTFWIGSLFLLFILSLSSCVSYEEVELKDIKSLKIIEFSGNNLKVETHLKILNPNSYSIKVIDSQFDVFIKNIKIGNAKIDSPIKFAAKSNDYQKVIISSTIEKDQLNSLTSIFAMAAFGKNEIAFKLDGYVKGKAMAFKKKIDIVHEGKVPLELFK
jgi:LEA14-like dessication related protein